MLKNKKILYTAVGICVILSGIFYYIGRSGENTSAVYNNKEQTKAELVTVVSDKEQDTTGEVCVYVCGYVNSPGVYYIRNGARVADAVEAAGGIAEGAYPDILNLADMLTDGQRIYVPAIGETDNAMPAVQDGRSDLVNINTADVSQLATLPGIGESRATSIIAYREENGAYGTIEDIMNVSGIKEAAFSKIKDYICV